MQAQDGSIALALRYQLACKAFAHTAAYDTAIAGYLGARAFEEVQGGYRLGH